MQHEARAALVSLRSRRDEDPWTSMRGKKDTKGFTVLGLLFLFWILEQLSSQHQLCFDPVLISPRFLSRNVVSQLTLSLPEESTSPNRIMVVLQVDRYNQGDTNSCMAFSEEVSSRLDLL